VIDQRFGGNWTEVKLARLHKYLRAYRQIFVHNEQARFFKTWFVDAFAGTGVDILLTLPTRRRTGAALSPRLPVTFPTSQLGATRERLLYFSASVEHSSLSA